MAFKKLLFIFCIVAISPFTSGIKLSAQHNASWGRPPDGWDDFYLGLVNDYKKPNDVGEPGYWLDVISKANGLSTYNAADPNKKSVLYQYKYINAGVDTATNWNSQKGLPPYGMSLLEGMRYDADVVGMRNAWVIYMMQEDGGATVARDNIANAVWLKKYFLNIKYVAQTGAGRKEIFILEPDLFGYIIQHLWNAGATATGMSGGVGLNMTAPMSTIATDPEYSYLAGLPNNFEGVIQGLIRTIRKYNPQAYCGVAVNLWGAWIPTVMGPAPAKTGLVWWNTAQIDAAVTYQAAFYQGLLLDAGYDKGDFLVPEKNGFPAYLAVGGQTHWMWGDQQMVNYLYFFEKMGKSVCLPLVAWQVSLGQSNNAASFGITLTSPPAAPYAPITNGSQSYEDTFVQYMFNNINGFINAGFIGFLGGKGMTQGTDYSLQTGYGDKGFFFARARTAMDSGRPWNLNRGVAIPDLGGDTTLCGTGGSLVLNPGNMGATSILWSTGATTPTITINSAGTYWVQVGGASDCVRRDTIVVSNTFSVNLGTTQNLCSSGSMILDADHQGTNVTYVWKKNGVVISNETTRYLTVSNPGTYRVEVTDPGCLPMKAHDIVISSTGLTTNSVVCVSFPSVANLSVTNTGGTYRWYTSPTIVSSEATGNNYTTPILSTATTYYVADEAMYNTTIIPKTAANGFTNSPANGNPEATTDNDWLYFDVLKDIQLVSLSIEAILYWSSGTQTATLNISNTSTGFNYSQAINYPTASVATGPTLTTGVLTLPTVLTIPKGTGYRIRVDAAYSLAYYKGSLSAIVHPKTHSDLVKTTGYSCALGCAVAGMPAIYNWNIKAASTCARTPVYIRDCGGSLPVDWLAFEVKIKENSTHLNWSTSSETNSAVFYVERSRDGFHFETIGDVMAQGNSTSIQHYFFVDKSAHYGTNYYRIRQSDLDGSFHYSDVKMISFSAYHSFIVYPNPSHNHFYIAGGGLEENQELYVELQDMRGKVVLNKTIHIQNAEPYLFHDPLPAGIYILKIHDEMSEYTFKLVKQ